MFRNEIIGLLKENNKTNIILPSTHRNQVVTKCSKIKMINYRFLVTVNILIPNEILCDVSVSPMLSLLAYA